MQAAQRISKEIRQITELAFVTYCRHADQDDDLHFVSDAGREKEALLVQMVGPEQTPYSGGYFTMCITFPDEYPFKPFKVYFLTPIVHPNFIATHDYWTVCNCSMGYQLSSKWQPLLNPAMILTKIRGLLFNPEIPLCISHKSTIEYND